MTKSPTLQDLKNLVREAGFTVSDARSFESETHIYAFSKESAGRATYGSPTFTACFSKVSGYLTQTGKQDLKLV